MAMPSPREFMKQRRPERFSDSVVIRQAKLNRSQLEYHLASITSRSQEMDFQHFCVKLAQFEICPDLRPQTGPSGGGDSKVDAENIPISDYTAKHHWQGIAGSHNERWAFAISAKKDWRTKVKNDMAGIASTNRGYVQAYFLTNQFAPDKQRAALEDSLSAQLGFRVTILDLNWILDKVFTNNRLKLAIDELRLGEGFEETIQIGPLDIQRQRQLNALSTEIDEAVAAKRVTYAIVNQTLAAALLGRGLGKPQADLKGLFYRAIKMAESYGSKEQVFSARYQQAWTDYFWFEDFAAFNDAYDTLEQLAKKSKNIFTAERQSNLFNILFTLYQNGVELKAEYIKKKRKAIEELLKQFVKEVTRPSAALQAKAIWILTQLADRKLAPKKVGDCFAELSGVMQESTNLIGFPYESIYTIIQELGNIYADHPEYEKLINEIVALDTRRKGEIPASLTFLNFSLQHLEQNRIYKGIIMLGKSLHGLYKQESKEHLVEALYFLSLAYKKIGLMWAARGSLLNAAALASSDFWTYNEINTIQAKCIDKLKWLELQLGRVGYALEWQNTHHILSMNLAKTEQEKEEMFKETFRFGATLGCLLIKTPKEKLSELEKLPDVLLGMDLDFSAFALMYLLGGKKYLPDEFLELENVPDVNAFFSNYLSQPAQKDIASVPQWYNEQEVQLKSQIIGGVWNVSAPNTSPSIEIAENLLASLESFLATATKTAIASRATIRVQIMETTDQTAMISFTASPETTGNLIIRHRAFHPHRMSIEDQREAGNAIEEAVLHLIANNVRFQDEKVLDQFREEGVMERSTNFLSAMVTVGNLLGYTPKRNINDWMTGELTAFTYEPDDSRVLRPANTIQEESPEEDIDNLEDDHSSDEPGPPDRLDISHKKMKIISLIDDPLWNKAHWAGVMYATGELEDRQPPTMALMFRDTDAGKRIFQQWKTEFGRETGKKLRISIIKGINHREPFWYTITIGSVVDKKEMREGHLNIFMTRMCTMTPTAPNNLQRFEETAVSVGACVLVPAAFTPDLNRPKFFGDAPVLCHHLEIRHAWQIGLNDVDMAAINEFKPVIPNDIKNAPVLELLAKKGKNFK